MLFLLPTGAAGNEFIEEMIRLANSWAYKSDLETIVLKALKIIPGLFFQKTLNSKSKELESTETKIIAREKWATRPTYV